jgi:hypothetical protein
MRESGVCYRLRPPLPQVTWNYVAKADRLTVYSLSPEAAGSSEGCDRLHGYPILSQADVADSRIAEVYMSLRAGEEEGTLGVRCFIPHHGVRATCGEKTLDLVVCFQCTNMAVFESSESENCVWADMSGSPWALMNDLLGVAMPLFGDAKVDEDAEAPDEYVSWSDL